MKQQPQSIPVIVTQKETGLSREFHSHHAAAKALSLNAKQVRQASLRNSICHGYIIERQVPISESSVEENHDELA